VPILTERSAWEKWQNFWGITREEAIKEFHKKSIPIRKLSKEDVIAEVEVRWKAQIVKRYLGEAMITKEVLEEFNLGLKREILPKVELSFEVVELKRGN